MLGSDMFIGTIMAAYSWIAANIEAGGVDEMPVSILKDYLHKVWPRIKEKLLAWIYALKQVRKVEIFKPWNRTFHPSPQIQPV
jgi:hypothetical protein